MESNDREDRRLKGLADLAAVVTHQMNNDLAEVVCSLGLMLEELGDGTPPTDLADLLDDAIVAADRATSLSSDALGLFRLDVESAPSIPLSTYLARACSFWDRRMRFVLDLGDDVQVRAKPEVLDRIMIPIVINAREAQHGGALQVGVRTWRVEGSEVADTAVDALPDGPFVAIAIRDRGPGIASWSTREVFDPFVSTKEGHRGLGLTIALNVARAHGGTMGARNHPDGGVEVMVWLPICDP